MNFNFDITKNQKSQIVVSNDILNEVSNYIKNIFKDQKIILITQKKILDIHGLDLINSLSQKISKDVINTIIINDGEEAKSFNSIKSVYLELQKIGANRESVIISFGGGVVGDVSGFIASTFMRGIKLINIPTTLLSMVDSSIGGKNGINSSYGKNIIGTFYNAEAIFIDSNFLRTLDKRQLISGIGEVIKYGIAFDKGFFKFVSSNIDTIIKCSDFTIYNDLINKCVKIKISIIKNDMYDNDNRRLLNFGHTLGHALEKYYEYNYLLHGEAVLHGILFASTLSNLSGNLSTSELDCIIQLIGKLDLPDIGEIDSDKVINDLKNDKKVINDKICFILLDEIGKAKIVNDINHEEIKRALNIL